jgi:2-keto-4-pentenoate hydratase/2-oxohepta-3-ene-1,7-dioic acid hydratase in catechol pathway
VKFARIAGAEGRPVVGLVAGDELQVVPDAHDLLALIQAGALDDAAAQARAKGARVDLASVTYLAPIATPPTVRDFYAFEQHVKAGRAWRGLEMEPDWYELPVFYFSNPYAITGSGDIAMPPGTSQFDFELEVAAVVGTAGRDVPAAEGDALIAGFCVMNDWSARDLQQREMKLSMGPVKGKDTATGIGPWFVTPDELADARQGNGYALTMRCSVNGRPYSEAMWSDVYWSFGEMIAYASRGTEVRPGDVIGSGTCGSGCILELSHRPNGADYPWLRPGDRVVASVDGLGELSNTIVAGAEPRPLRGADR